MPYHQVLNKIRVADGMAMSCRNTGIIQPSLRLVYDEIERSTETRIDRNPDLVKWANQGILMLNTALTTSQGKPGNHTDLWRPFTKYLLSTLSARHPSLIWVFMGNHAKGYASYVTSGTKFYTKHPASAAYTGGKWESDNLFTKLNVLLESRGLDKIIW